MLNLFRPPGADFLSAIQGDIPFSSIPCCSLGIVYKVTYSLTQPTFSLMEHIKFVFNFTQRYPLFSFIDRKFKVHLQTKIGAIIISCFQLLCML